MAQTEVVKSSINIEELEYSTKSLKELQGRYSAFDAMLHGSQRLVRHLEEADKWDRIYMIGSLSFLALVLLWIIWRRILKAPIMLLLWTLTRGFKLARFVGGASRLKTVLHESAEDPAIDAITATMIESTATNIAEGITASITSLTSIAHTLDHDNL